MKPVETTNSKSLVDYLPAIYREDPFLEKYLSAFEKILLGRNDGKEIPGEKDRAETRSLEETIDRIPALFDPLDRDTPADFLPWLASWAALSLRADLDEKVQRDFIANIIQRYQRRGTKENLIELLKIFTKTTPEIDEEAVPSAGFKEQHREFDTDTRPLHFFKVSVFLRDPKQDTVVHLEEIARAIIDLEKPAHTFYELKFRFESMQITDKYPDDEKDKAKYRANLGVDTLITDKLMITVKGKKHGRS
jgi:phage tail-like protein